MRVGDLSTPALVVDGPAFERNLATMAGARPGSALRPHVKAHKSTAVARLQQEAGHDTFCAATARVVVGLAAAGVGSDLLLANQCLDADRITAMADCRVPVTVAVDSAATIAAAASAGIGSVLIDVNVGLPCGGCAPDQAGSYVFSDTAYRQVVPEFELALHVVATVLNAAPEYAVADCGLKALGMDHGSPAIGGADVGRGSRVSLGHDDRRVVWPGSSACSSCS